MKKIIVALVVVVGVLGADAHAMSIFDQSKRIEALESELKQTKAKMDIYDSAIERLEKNSKYSLDMIKMLDAAADLNNKYLGHLIPNRPELDVSCSKGVAVFTMYGHVYVIPRKIVKNDNGSEIYIEVVNFTSVAIDGIEVSILYSSKAQKYDDVKEIGEHFKHITQEVEGLFIPASPRLIKIGLPGRSPEEIKYAEIYLEPKSFMVKK